MSPVAAPDTLDRWRAQPCTNAMIESIEHARFGMDLHGGHGGCEFFMAALKRLSVVLG
ncbi:MULTISPECIES: hypothetical protein [Nocardia]|uniref:hypothetical protein n=1 Tax=Nocardia TaxID=1817 RepID=UPI00135869F6|nr:MULTISPECIES: hypothetical protein [Nocardia]